MYVGGEMNYYQTYITAGTPFKVILQPCTGQQEATHKIIPLICSNILLIHL